MPISKDKLIDSKDATNYRPVTIVTTLTKLGHLKRVCLENIGLRII